MVDEVTYLGYAAATTATTAATTAAATNAAAATTVTAINASIEFPTGEYQPLAAAQDQEVLAVEGTPERGAVVDKYRRGH